MGAWIFELFFIVQENIKAFGEAGSESNKEVMINKFLNFFLVELNSDITCNKIQFSLPDVNFSWIVLEDGMNVFVISDLEIVGGFY